MPSPFPGMNPYLEQEDTWEDFHHNFPTRAQEALNRSVGANYLVKVEARVYIRAVCEAERRFFGRADVAMSTSSEPGSAAAVASIAAPVELILPEVEYVRDSWLEVRDRRDRRVITVIELLSPTDKKRGPDHGAYLSKRNILLGSDTSLVEIDLHRGGQRPALPPLPDCDYYALVSQYECRPRIGFWPIGLHDRLPLVPVPLAASDAAVSLDLQAVLDGAYDSAGYGIYLCRVARAAVVARRCRLGQAIRSASTLVDRRQVRPRPGLLPFLSVSAPHPPLTAADATRKRRGACASESSRSVIARRRRAPSWRNKTGTNRGRP